MPIARYYIGSENTEGAYLPGVPLGNLSDEEYEALPEWLRRSVDGCPFYSAEPPIVESKAEGEEKDAPKARTKEIK